MKSAILDSLRRWKDFSGRSNRKEFWWFYFFFLLMPLVSAAISLIFILLLSLLNLDSLAIVALPFSYLYLLLVPSLIAVSVRRMHDVGRPGWCILIPVYNFYLYVQPSVENGRIPKWILAERVSLGFVAILGLSLLTGDFQTYLGGFVFWSAVFLLIRRKNRKVT